MSRHALPERSDAAGRSVPLAANSPLPWQRAQWQGLQRQLESGCLPHAILLRGAPGVGKLVLARVLAQSVLCERRLATQLACGRCASCHWFGAGTHPDFFVAEPEASGKPIGIDQIRALREMLGLTPRGGIGKFALVVAAESMTLAAANSLLKTLEEPPPATFLMLLTAHPDRLPATIRSRCQLIALGPASPTLARPWLGAQLKTSCDLDVALALAAGSPLRALRLIEDGALARRADWLSELAQIAAGAVDPIAVAERWSSADPLEWLHGLASWVSDMIRVKITAEPPTLVNTDLRPLVEQVGTRVSVGELFGHLDALTRAARLVTTTVNPRLLLEELLVAWRPAPREPV